MYTLCNHFNIVLKYIDRKESKAITSLSDVKYVKQFHMMK